MQLVAAVRSLLLKCPCLDFRLSFATPAPEHPQSPELVCAFLGTSSLVEARRESACDGTSYGCLIKFQRCFERARARSYERGQRVVGWPPQHFLTLQNWQSRGSSKCCEVGRVVAEADRWKDSSKPACTAGSLLYRNYISYGPSSYMTSCSSGFECFAHHGFAVYCGPLFQKSIRLTLIPQRDD